MFRNVLVPLDGSAFAEQALPLALNIAGRANANLHLLRVHIPYRIEDPTRGWALFDPAEDAVIRRQELTYLENLARRDTGDKIRDFSCAVEDGFTVDAILGQARKVTADLIVMTTHGRGPLSRAFLGSVADELVRRSPIPVLLIRPQDALPDFRRPAAVSRMLIPLDRSPACLHILGPALQLGSILGASYTLLHVVHPDQLPARTTESERAAGLCRSWQEHEAEQSLAYLEQLAQQRRGPSAEIQTRVVVNRHIACAILDAARTYSCDLIAMAMHGRTGFRKLLLGSVSDKVLRSATCPVLVYREPD